MEALEREEPASFRLTLEPGPHIRASRFASRDAQMLASYSTLFLLDHGVKRLVAAFRAVAMVALAVHPGCSASQINSAMGTGCDAVVGLH